MTFADFIQLIFGIAIAGFGFAFRRIFGKLDEGAVRMSKLEVELMRQKQETEDMGHWMKRIESKVDLLIERQMKK
tara:strand:- start:125 stop:349 length:225 start_codon:yes stop_codon:yes gene_type:complete